MAKKKEVTKNIPETIYLRTWECACGIRFEKGRFEKRECPACKSSNVQRIG